MKNLSALALVATFASAAHATDDVIEINAARVAASGGYPYVISQPGSYRLTSNLTQPDIQTSVIRVAADDVSIDLNGFAIKGTNVCTPTGNPQHLVCSNSGSGNGIDTAGGNLYRVAVTNGSVTGIAGDCVGAWGGRVERVQVAHCGYTGIGATRVINSVATYSERGISACDVLDSTASGNDNGIYLYSGVIARSTITDNFGQGLVITLGAATGNVIANNSSTGIHALDGTTLTGNSISNNGGAGLTVDAGEYVAFSQNILRNNTGGSLSGSPKSLPASSNWCDMATCP